MPFSELGVATSNLTFFRQIGGTVSLAIVGTLFASSFKDQLVPSLTADELHDMERFNPKSAAEYEEEKQEEDFLKGAPTGAPAAKH